MTDYLYRISPTVITMKSIRRARANTRPGYKRTRVRNGPSCGVTRLYKVIQCGVQWSRWMGRLLECWYQMQCVCVSRSVDIICLLRSPTDCGLKTVMKAAIVAQRAWLQVNTSSERSWYWGMSHTKIHLISPGCPWTALAYNT